MLEPGVVITTESGTVVHEPIERHFQYTRMTDGDLTAFPPGNRIDGYRERFGHLGLREIKAGAIVPKIPWGNRSHHAILPNG